MERQGSRRAVLRGCAAGATWGLAGCLGATGGPGTAGTAGTPGANDVTVFHAGSLSAPFAAAEPRFEERNEVEVTREAQGSVASTQKITQQGRAADVLGVSDFRLIRDRLLPEFGDWYAIFATNAMSLQYRSDSPGADVIGSDNWWEILARDGVVLGHSDPAVDPGGYRAVMTMQLGSVPFRGRRLYGESTYRRLRENAVVPTGTETNLVAQLEAGELDYALYYQSISSTSGLPYVDLQPAVDLSRATDEHAAHYAKAAVETASGTFVGAPIAYGLTVPSVARAPALGARWVELFATDEGRQLLRDEGFVPVAPAVVPEEGAGAVPPRVLDVTRVQANLGPHEL